MTCKHILWITFSNEPEHFLLTVKWFQVLLYKSNNLTSVICLLTYFVLFDLSGTITLGQSGPGRNGNAEVLYIHQISRAGVLPSNCLMSYPTHLLGGGSDHSAEMQSVYSTAPANRDGGSWGFAQCLRDSTERGIWIVLRQLLVVGKSI